MILCSAFNIERTLSDSFREFRDRLAKFGLELHADKTRLIEFGRFAARNRKQTTITSPFAIFLRQTSTHRIEDVVWRGKT